MYRANLGKVDLSFAADTKVGAEVHLAPDADAELVARANDEVSWCRSVIDWTKRGGLLGEELGSINRQRLSGRGRHKVLELTGRLRRNGAHFSTCSDLADCAFREVAAAWETSIGRRLVRIIRTRRPGLRTLLDTQC